jgi:hypothetical protein
MNIKEIILDIEDLFLDAKDDGFNITLSQEDIKLAHHKKYEFFISYTKHFTIDKIDTVLYKIDNYLKYHNIPFVFQIWIAGEGLKQVYLYDDDRYIRYEGIKLKDWNLIKYIKLNILVKIHPVEWKK